MQLISFARGAPSLDIIDIDGLKAAATRAFEVDPGGVTAYGTSVGYLPLRAWIAERHGVEPDQVIVTNGSLQADALLFEHLVKRDDAVIVEKPTYDRTLLGLRNLGAEVHQVTLAEDGIDVDELRKLLESGVRPEARARDPQLPEPGRDHPVGGQAARAASIWPSSSASRSSRTTPTRTSASGARSCRRCSRSTPTAWSCTRARSPRRYARACASATWSARRR